MALTKTNYFFDTIYNLRNSGQLILYNKIFTVDIRDEADVTDLLKVEYENECFEYPFTPPAFDAAAALWAAKTIFISAQLILHRDMEAHYLPSILPAYTAAITGGAILSADICLRFLPQLLTQIKLADPEDALRHILEECLRVWHYSGIGYNWPLENIGFDDIVADKCILQLYINRIISRKDKRLAGTATLHPHVKAALGDYEHFFWKDLSI